jgi:hypothetical protein
MNALKHGLDAETLILPGEDEPAFQARLDSWKASLPPRNPREEALLEQVARLSWQLDRADRVVAAHLTERIRHAQSDEARQHPEAEAAAEAEQVGRRLLAGPPLPTYDLDRIQERLDRLYASEFWSQYTPVFDLSGLRGKRLARPVHPDDPDHPARLLRRLEATAAGCRWLLDRWAELHAALDGDAGWSPDERLRAVRLLGKEPADAVDDPMVQSIYLCAFVLGGKDPQVFDDQLVEMIRREFEYFLERWQGRRLSRRLPPDKELARARLMALVEGIIAHLEERAAGHAARAESEAASAAQRLAFDDSPQGKRLLRLHSRILGAFFRTVDLLMKVRRRPDAFVPRPDPDENVATSPGDSNPCEKIRNEPNAPASPVISEVEPRPDAGGQSPEASSLGGGDAGLTASVGFGNGGSHRILLRGSA